ncbi:hypothetical protein PS903_05107 [Pseudomonas fluorescens]|nr:hypothetical protein PS903_05107 [Pseudomonas fluorescens]
MDVNDNAFILNKRVAFETIASKLAPTEEGRGQARARGNRGFRPTSTPPPHHFAGS